MSASLSNYLLLDPTVLTTARRLAQDSDCSLPFAIKQVTGWTADVTVQALAGAFSYDLADAVSLHGLRPRFDLIAFSDCTERGVAVGTDPADSSDALCLIISDPFDSAAQAWALRRAGMARIRYRVMLADIDELQAFFARYEGTMRAIDGDSSHDSNDDDGEVAATISLTDIASQTSPIIRLVNSAIHDALQMGASDIHWESDAASLRVLCRIDGVLVPVTQVAGREAAEQAISRIKVMADLDIAERRIPQDGRFKVRINGREVDLRVSVMPSIFGEDAVLRLLDRQALSGEAVTLRLDDLRLGVQAMAGIRRLARMPHGMVLVTGPTGSGKTTTLYAAITEIHTGRDKIITIEDPVEYRLPRILQIPVNEKKGLTFARGLRSILRHDPDKIMVGEIRDDETAQIAVQAALTGHLVFTTVHANSVFDVLGRFLHMGVDAYSFAAALNGIVSQRLLRMNCTHCVQDHHVTNDELLAAGLELAELATWTMRKSLGCAHCRGTGYKGRLAVAEVLILDDVSRELIASKAPILQLKERAIRLGMRTVLDEALACVAAGRTTLEEVARVAG
jgi:general secretion pathway protein E